MTVRQHGWIHVQCYSCWFQQYGLDPEPARFQHRPVALTCCFCGQLTNSRIRRGIQPWSESIPFCPDAAQNQPNE